MIAGSVSSGMFSSRSCSKLSRLRLTPLSACCSSASVKSTPKIFSAQSSVAWIDRAPARRLLRASGGSGKAPGDRGGNRGEEIAAAARHVRRARRHFASINRGFHPRLSVRCDSGRYFLFEPRRDRRCQPPATDV